MRKFDLLLRPRGCLYQDISIMVILTFGETGGLDGQTYTKAEQSGKTEKVKEVEYHHQS